jgi:hypothetical protein
MLTRAVSLGDEGVREDVPVFGIGERHCFDSVDFRIETEPRLGAQIKNISRVKGAARPGWL